jgi:hypothetical protein
MGIFGSLFQSQAQPQPQPQPQSPPPPQASAPVDMNANPYAASAAVYDNPWVRFFGGQSAADDHAAAVFKAQRWQAAHDLGQAFQAPQPQLPDMGTGAGPMGGIAAYAQGPQAAQPFVPPPADYRARMAAAAATGVDISSFGDLYNSAQEAAAADKAPAATSPAAAAVPRKRAAVHARTASPPMPAPAAMPQVLLPQTRIVTPQIQTAPPPPPPPPVSAYFNPTAYWTLRG